MDLNEWIFGSPDKFKKLDTGTKSQQQFGGEDLIALLQQMMGQGGGLDLANQYDKSLLGQGPEAFNQFSSPYLQQFQEQIIPQIEERYAGAGALSSSAFGQAIGGAGAGLQSELAKLFSSLQAGAAGRQQGQFQNLSNTGLGYQPYAYERKAGNQGMLGTFANSAINSFAGPAANMALQGIQGLFKR
jgi:hypothetical protein